MSNFTRKSLFEAWWDAQTKKGDPSKNPHLVRDAFYEGFDYSNSLLTATQSQLSEASAEVERLTKERDQAIEAGAMRIGPDNEILMTPVTVLESEDCPDLFDHLKARGEV